MHSRHYSLVFLTTTLLIAFTAEWVNALSLTGETGGYDISITFQDGNQELDTLTAHGNRISLLAPPDQNSAFMKTLTSLFPKTQGWTFTPATSNNLPGVFNVDYFQAYLQPGQTTSGQLTVDAGANIKLTYIPPQNIPSPDPNTLHWIQRVTKYNLSGRKGNSNNFIDVPSTQNNPFYDLIPDINLPNKYTFVDVPGKVRYQANTTVIVDTFIAQLFLVGIPDPVNAPKTVTIYNGIKWGWSNTFTPPPPPPPPPPCNGSSGGGGCRTALASNIQVQNQALSDIEISKSSPTPVSVPEPIPALGLLALGIWGTFQGLKIIKDKQ